MRLAFRRGALPLAGLVATAALALPAMRPGSDPPAPAAELPVPVTAERSLTQDVQITARAIGTVEPCQSVNVLPRVDGYLVSTPFEEGQLVRRGEVVATIDARPYRAQLVQAEANLMRDQALLANARRDLGRFQQLLRDDAVARQQLDTQASLVRQLEATVKADEGGADAARLNVEYARITAPIDGKVGMRLVDVGNFVTAAKDSIAVINQLSPAAVTFSVPQSSVSGGIDLAAAPLVLYSQETGRALGRGQVQAVDNHFDSATGTLQLKASVPNADQRLLPGQAVEVEVVVGRLPHAVVVPSSAVQDGPQGPVVFLVAPDGRAAVRPVQMQYRDAQIAAVTGIAAGTLVVTDGQSQLESGTKVRVQPTGTAAR